MEPFDCTMRTTTSDAGSTSDWMMTSERPSSDNHERIDETNVWILFAFDQNS